MKTALHLTIAASVLAALSLSTTVVQAQFNYTTNNGTITITGYTGRGGAVTIPDTIAGLAVTSIDDEAFAECSTLTSVTVPAGVTYIGYQAFGCEMLASITVEPANPNYSSADGVLFNKAKTKLICYPQLKDGPYTVPASVVEVDDGAFEECSVLTSITLPAGLLRIGESAFHDCKGLTSVAIPASVSDIGPSALADCSAVTSIFVDPANPYFSSIGGVLFNKSQTVLMQYPAARGGTYTIPASVTQIPDEAFEICDGLTSISVDPANAAFSSVEGVLFNRSRTLLIRCPAGKGGAFTIPSTVITIGYSAFDSCAGLTNVVIPPSVTTIGHEAFGGDRNGLTTVFIPASVTSIDDSFNPCPQLISITVDPANPNYSSADGVLFDKTRSWLIQYPAARNGAYTLPVSVTNIDGSAFSECPGLTSIAVATANPSYSAVEGVLFNKQQTRLIRCPGVKAGAYAIPSGITVVDDDAFAGCRGLTSVMVPASVTIMEEAFQGCGGLVSITVDPGNPVYSSADGVLFDEEKNRLIRYPAARGGAYTAPDTVISIGKGAFAESRGLVSVIVPRGLICIGREAFASCTSLLGAYFAGDAPSLGWSGFGDATNATVYYLAGTTGWGTTFGGRPTALWQPQVESGGASFGVRTNRFGFNITWACDQVVVVEASTTASNPTWSSVATNTLTGGSSYFSDPLWADYPARFYRIRSP